MNIQTRIEKERGCGYRKPGGLYLVSGAPAKECGKLPIELTVCKCCGQGIKPSRGFSWIEVSLIEDAPCRLNEECTCGLSQEPWNLNSDEKVGLMWVGGSFYKTPNDFMREANIMGISKRIAHIPKDLVVGETWVMLAHRQAVTKGVHPHQEKVAGIFQAFRPTAIEYVVKDDDSEKKLQRLEKQGVTLVKVKKDVEQGTI